MSSVAWNAWHQPTWPRRSNVSASTLAYKTQLVASTKLRSKPNTWSLKYRKLRRIVTKRNPLWWMLNGIEAVMPSWSNFQSRKVGPHRVPLREKRRESWCRNILRAYFVRSNQVFSSCFYPKVLNSKVTSTSQSREFFTPFLLLGLGTTIAFS